MVTTVNDARTIRTIVKRTPFVVELVGPAGTGKTTLSQALSRRSESILRDYPPDVRSLANSPFFIKHCFLLLPTIFRLYKNNDRYLVRREIGWMAILSGWHHFLRRCAAKDRKVILLEHGPVFMLAHLYKFGSGSLRRRSAEKWWKGMYKQWAATLDMVVWLDTSDTCLLERIRLRDNWHIIKDKQAPEVFEFLANYRVAYEKVISMLTANCNSPKVLHFDTARESLDGIVNGLLAEFCLKNDEGEVIHYLPTESLYNKS